MKFFKQARDPDPVLSIDHRGMCRTAIDLALRDATNGYSTRDWALLHGLADDLEAFAHQLRCSIALGRPL
jgi:hypothetical protein